MPTNPRAADPRVCWVDGALVPIDEPAVRVDDSAYLEGRGCYTTARIRAGRARFLDRHVKRLLAAARELRVGELEAALIERAMNELAAAAFPDADGVIRLQASRDGRGRLRLVGIPRAVGPEPPTWSAVIVPLPHDGVSLATGRKVSSRLTLALAFERAQEAGADEAILLDAADRLVEGARSNLVLVLADGAWVTPPTARGGVAGVARGLVLERAPEVKERDVSRSELLAARELIAVNAVRGACPITRLDDRPVGDGRPGIGAERLAAALERD